MASTNKTEERKPTPRWMLALLLCGTLGLAPFFPEPHVWGKLKWLMGGGEGMQLMDIFDLLLHGTPWVWLMFELFRKFK